MNCSPPGSSDHGVSQAWILKWVAISFSRGCSWSRDRTWVSCIAESLPSETLGKPLKEIILYLGFEGQRAGDEHAAQRMRKAKCSRTQQRFAFQRRREQWMPWDGGGALCDFPLPRVQTTECEPGSSLALFAKYVAYVSLLSHLKTHTQHFPCRTVMIKWHSPIPFKAGGRIRNWSCQFLDKGISYDSLPSEKTRDQNTLGWGQTVPCWSHLGTSIEGLTVRGERK